MSIFLGRKPLELGFNEIKLSTLEEKQQFIGGQLGCIRFPMEIDLWINDEYLDIAENETHNLCILHANGETLHVYGNVFLASFDRAGETVPLSKEQLEWVKEHSELYIGTSKIPMILFDLRERAHKALNGGTQYDLLSM